MAPAAMRAGRGKVSPLRARAMRAARAAGVSGANDGRRKTAHVASQTAARTPANPTSALRTRLPEEKAQLEQRQEREGLDDQRRDKEGHDRHALAERAVDAAQVGARGDQEH